MGRVTKALTAEYDATLNALRLAEPLEGVSDHEQVTVIVDMPPRSEPPWMKLSGSLSQEAGEELARAVEEMFPIEKE
jgi:hypothetical protein